MLLFSERANELRLENEVQTLSWKVFMNILQPNLQVIIFVSFCQYLLSFTAHLPPGNPHPLNPLHTPKKDKSKVESQIIIHA